MKNVLKVAAIFFAVALLAQILDFSFFLMNQSDTYVFNIGLVVFASTLIVFGYLGLFMSRIIKPEVKEEIKEEIDQNKNKN
jgi:nitrate reductase gamma subunit